MKFLPFSVVLLLMFVLMPPFISGMNQTAQVRSDHDPILVGGNSDFLDLAQEENWDGNGSASSPIIVEGYRFYQASHMLRLSNIDLHIIFRNNEFDGIAKVWCAIVLDKVRNVVIANNTIHHAAAGVHVAWSNETTITGNEMYEIKYDGVFLDYYCYNNTIVGNEFHLMGETGVFAIGHSCDNVIIRNHMYDNPYGIFLTVGSDNNTLHDNRIRNCALHGVYVLTSGNIIDNNLIYNNQGTGVFVGSMTHHNAIRENFLFNNSRRGVEVSTAAQNVVEANDFIDNHKNPQASDNGTDNIFRNNYWSDLTQPDEDSDQIVDEPYAIAGTASNADNQAKVEPYHNVSAVLTSTWTAESLSVDYVPVGIGILVILPLVVFVITKLKKQH